MFTLWSSWQTKQPDTTHILFWPLKKKIQNVFNYVINRLSNAEVVPGTPAIAEVTSMEFKSNQQINGYNTPQEYFCYFKSDTHFILYLKFT